MVTTQLLQRDRFFFFFRLTCSKIKKTSWTNILVKNKTLCSINSRLQNYLSCGTHIALGHKTTNWSAWTWAAKPYLVHFKNACVQKILALVEHGLVGIDSQIKFLIYVGALSVVSTHRSSRWLVSGLFCHVIYGWCLLIDEESAGCAQARSISAWPKFPPIFKMLCIVVFNYCFVHWDRSYNEQSSSKLCDNSVCWCISSGSYIRWCVGVLTGKAQCVPAIVFFFFSFFSPSCVDRASWNVVWFALFTGAELCISVTVLSSFSFHLHLYCGIKSPVENPVFINLAIGCSLTQKGSV